MTDATKPPDTPAPAADDDDSPRMPKARGRFSREMVEVLLAGIELGLPINVASSQAGVTDRAFRIWRAKGLELRKQKDAGADLTEEEQLYVEFVDGLRKAKTAAFARCVQVIQNAAGQGTWQAAAWWLERNFPAQFALRQRLEHSGPGGQPIETKGVRKLEIVLTDAPAEAPADPHDGNAEHPAQ